MTAEQILATVNALLTAAPLHPLDALRERRPCALIEHSRVGTRYHLLRIEAPEAYRARHERPAQYVTLKTDDTDPRFFVIASAPSQEHWDFLIEAVDDVAPFFEAIEAGKEILASPPEGGGFVPELARGHHAHLFATGSGVATMRPLIQHWMADPELAPAKISLYYGENASEDFVYCDDIELWRKAGVDVHFTLGSGATGEFPHQFVQHAFDAGEPVLDDALVYLSGAPIMMEVVADKLLRMGLSADRLLTNI